MAVHTATTAPLARARVLPRWPILALFVGYPLWWLLGLGGFIWPLLAAPLALAMLVRGHIRVPRGFGIWLLFLGWMAVSAVQLDSGGRALGWAYRAALYVSATVVFLAIYNTPRSRLPVRTLALTATVFWAYVVAGGYLGVLFPRVSFSTPMQMVMPGSLLSNDLVRDLVHPSFAQVAYGAAPRPEAPFTYTNEWGANFALLVPLVFVALGQVRGALRGLVLLLLPLALVPAALSLNRGLYLSLGAGLAYAAVRLAARGRLRALTGLLVLLLVAGGVASVLPVRELLTERVTTSATNTTRLSLYSEAIERVKESPLLGYGAPRPSEEGPGAPSVGTQGQFWMVLFSHGVPGLALFVGWFLWAAGRTRRALTPPWLWAHVTLVIATIQLPYYGMLPSQLHVVMLAAGIAFREREEVRA